MWDHLVRQSSLSGCPCLPLLLVWTNVSSLTPWLLDFHTVQFSGSYGCFFVLKFVVGLLVLRGSKVRLPVPPSWLEVLIIKYFLWCLPWIWFRYCNFLQNKTVSGKIQIGLTCCKIVIENILSSKKQYWLVSNFEHNYTWVFVIVNYSLLLFNLNWEMDYWTASSEWGNILMSILTVFY